MSILVRCKGNTIKCPYSKGRNEEENYKKAKEPCPKNCNRCGSGVPSINKDNKKSYLFLEDVPDWINTGGYIALEIPPGYIALDSDKNPLFQQYIDGVICDNKLRAGTQKTQNGKHYVFKVNVEFEASSDVFLKGGIKATYRTRKSKSYILVEPSMGKEWLYFPENWENISELPDLLTPLDIRDSDNLLRAVAHQLKFLTKTELLGEFLDIEFAFLDFITNKLQVDIILIKELFKIIFDDEYDETRTTQMIERAKKKENAEKKYTIASLIEKLKFIQADHVVQLITFVEGLHMRAESKKGTASRPVQGLEIFSARELIEKELPPIVYVVPDLLPEGLIIIAGHPKLGKSLFALNISLAITKGNMVLEKIKIDKNDVLYVAMEDSQRRLQDRIRNLNGFDGVPENLHLTTNMNALNSGGFEQLALALEKYPNIKLIIIDTWQRVKGQSLFRGNSYEEDYDTGARLQKFALDNKIALLLIHHLKKGKERDFIEQLSGSMGVTGSADTVMVMERERNQNEAILKITGRDVREQELVLMLKENGQWELLGEASCVQITQERQEIIDLLQNYGKPLSGKEISGLLDKKYDNTRYLLSKLMQDGLITKIDRKGYILTVKCESANTPHTPHSPHSPHTDEIIKPQAINVSAGQISPHIEEASIHAGFNPQCEDVRGVSTKKEKES